MPTVTLSRLECNAGLLPPICDACGEPATDRVSHSFSWRPRWSESTSLVDWQALRTTKVRLPLCPEHVREARWRTWILVIILVPVVALMAFGLAFVLDALPGWVGPFESLAIVMGLTLWVFVGIGIHKLVLPERFHAARITDRILALRGVHRAFAAAVEAGPPPVRHPLTAESSPSADRSDVVLSADEYRADRLPPVCVRCGVPTPHRVSRRVRRLPQGWACLMVIPIIAGMVFCPPVVILMVLLMGERVSVRVPLCSERQSDWGWRDRVSWWLLLPIWSVVATGLTVSAILDAEHRWLYVAGNVLGLLVMVTVEWGMNRKMVLAQAAEGTDVRLCRVHPDFAAALAGMRERNRAEHASRPEPVRDEWDDYDDDPMDPRPRPRRRRRDDWDDDDPDRRAPRRN